MQLIGKTISHFTIERELGSGGMGTVYLALDKNLNRKVALKLLSPALTADKTNQARFRQEARAMAALNHPRIATVYETGQYDQSWYIAMEYIQGKTLQDILNEKFLPFRDALNIIIQLCEGLREAHEKGIYHRDIKPGNLLIDDQGRLKIVDFGLAKLRNKGLITTKSGTIGTLYYLAPEQINNRTIDQRTDIFATGIILYQLLTGRLPFQGDYEAAVMYSILNDQPPDLHQYRRDLPENMQSVIDKVLQKDPAKRYQKITDLLNELKKFLNSDRTDSLTQHPTKKEKTKSVRKLAAIMFIDIVGYSRMMGINEDETLKLLEDYDQIVSPLIERHSGIILKKIGDGLFCEFSSAIDSAECALAIQLALNNYNQSSGKNDQLRVRIGVHVGDVIKKEADLYGDGVNVAARIEPLAPPGGIYISDSVHSAISSHPRFKIKELGPYQLKNISKRHTLYQLITGFEYADRQHDEKQAESLLHSDKTPKADSGKDRAPFLSAKKLTGYAVLIIIVLIIVFYPSISSFFTHAENNQAQESSTQQPSKQATNGIVNTDIASLLSSEKSQNFIAELLKIRTTKQLLDYLHQQQTSGLISFGRKADFFDLQGKYVVILDENKIYHLLYYYHSTYYDTESKDVYSNLSSSFKGKRTIWIELY